MTVQDIAATEGKDRRGAAPWFIAEGVVLILLAIVAAVLPLGAGLAAALVFGWVLILSGVMGFVAMFGHRGHAHWLWAALSALVAFVAGVLILWRPIFGAIALAVFIAAYLLVDAVALTGIGLDQRKRGAKGWIWLIVSSAVDLVLAAIILAMGPLHDVVLLGFFIAFDLLMAGIALITIGFAARRPT